MAHYHQTLLLGLFALISPITAHFYLNSPPSIGFDDSLEGTPPCGSFTPDFSTDNVTNFGVAGSAIALTSVHPQAAWLFRATLDQTASGDWTALLPAIQQTGLGDYCEQNVVIPASWAGSKGIIGVVQDAPDGILYQCATVNFVAGKVEAPSICKNVTGLSAVETSDPSLSSLPASATSTASSTSATSSSSSTSTAKPSAADTIHSHGVFGALAWASMIGCATIAAILL